MAIPSGLLNLVRPFFEVRPFADRTLCHFLRGRLTLPGLQLADLFDDFEEQPVRFQQLPRGSWSTPTQDLVMLLKLALCSKPKRLMEVGSFRGYTALSLAQHVDANAKIVTVDQYPEHGEAYRGSPEAGKIERRVGATSATLFASDSPGSYDLIFIDADHKYGGVKNDTEICLPLVSPNGYIVWHDYANWGYFNAYNGVPEYLGELSARLPIVHVLGSDLALYSPAWAQTGHPARNRYLSAIGHSSESTSADVWNTVAVR